MRKSAQVHQRKPLTGSLPTGGGGGATAFTDLTDVPASYAGKGGYKVKVNAGASGLEFVADTTPAHNDTTSKQGGSGSDFYHLPAPTANYIVRGNSGGTNAEYSDTIPDGIKATTQAAGDNSTKLATTKYVDAYELPNVVSPSTAIADIQTILADATDRDILFKAGTYAFASNDAVFGNAATRKKLIFKNATLTFNNGHCLKTWTAANANRYYNETDGRISYSVAGINPNFVKNAGAAFPTAVWTSDWKFALMGASFQLNAATSDASNLRPSDMPQTTTGHGATADFTIHNQRYCALCYPTENITMEGNLIVSGNSGHAGEWLFDAIGLWNSDLSKCQIDFQMPSGETWNGISRWWHCFNIRRRISMIKQKSLYIGNLAWDYMVNCFVVQETLSGHSNISYEYGADDNETWANVFQHWNGALIMTDCALDGMRHDKYTVGGSSIGKASGRQVDYNGIYNYSIRGYGRGINGSSRVAGNLKDLGRANCQDEDYTCFKGTI